MNNEEYLLETWHPATTPDHKPRHRVPERHNRTKSVTTSVRRDALAHEIVSHLTPPLRPPFHVLLPRFRIKTTLADFDIFELGVRNNDDPANEQYVFPCYHLFPEYSNKAPL